jgi:hypothetical protein
MAIPFLWPVCHVLGLAQLVQQEVILHVVFVLLAITMLQYRALARTFAQEAIILTPILGRAWPAPRNAHFALTMWPVANAVLVISCKIVQPASQLALALITDALLTTLVSPAVQPVPPVAVLRTHNAQSVRVTTTSLSRAQPVPRRAPLDMSPHQLVLFV